MYEYTVYYNGKKFTFCANSVDLMWQVARQQKGAQFCREAFLIGSQPTTSAAVAKAVGLL